MSRHGHPVGAEANPGDARPHPGDSNSSCVGPWIEQLLFDPATDYSADDRCGKYATESYRNATARRLAGLVTLRTKGGTAVLVGIPMTRLDVSAIDLVLQEKAYMGSIGGSCTPDRDFDTFVEWFEDGRLPLNDLVTARFAIDEVNEAVDALTAGRIAGRAIFEF